MSVDCEGGEHVDVDQQRLIRARKGHVCDACEETIERGHLYVRHTIIFGGTVEVTVRCLRCDAIYQELVVIHRAARADPNSDCYLEWPDLALRCGHEFEERWGREPPPELARLAFLTPAEVQAEAKAMAKP